MKRILSFFLIAIILITAIPVSAVTTKECGTDLGGENIYNHHYGQKAKAVGSYISKCSDGTLMTVIYDIGNGYPTKNIHVIYYTEDYKLIRNFTVEIELPIFGGFYETDDGYYLLFGQENIEESDEKEVVRIVKYNKNWERIDSISLYGENTSIPFKSGASRFAHKGTTLIIHTSHQMYDDGSGTRHQANWTIAFNSENMELIKSFAYPNDYDGAVSHSFNQYIENIDGNLVIVDHGDANPRSVFLQQFYGLAFSTWPVMQGRVYKSATMVDIPGAGGDNYTGVTVGGFVSSSTSFIVAGLSELEEKDKYNIYVSAVTKEGTEGKLRYLTNYQDRGATTPHLVKISDDYSLLIWTYWENVYYQMLDASGENYGELYKFEGQISDCKPVIIDGEIVWFTYNVNDFTFYSINTSDISKTTKTSVNFDHNFERENDDTHHWYDCSYCGELYDEKEAHFSGDQTYKTFTQDGDIIFSCGLCGYIYSREKLITEVEESFSQYGAHILDITLKTDSRELIEEKDYKQWRNDYTSVTLSSGAERYKTYTALFRVANPNYNSEAYIKTFVSIPYACDIEKIYNKLYTGSPIIPDINITYQGKKLTKDIDYTVTYENNTEIGTATAIIKGKGIYFGTIEKNFSIVSSLKHPFTDVENSAWYNDSVQYAYDEDLMKGMTATTFDPDGSSTRAQLVTVLFRMDGEPDREGGEPFYDVPPDEWYTKAVCWAYKNEIVLGTGPITFTPNMSITREQIATILYRFSKSYKNYDTSKSESISYFPDASKVSDYAKEALEWAYAEGLITGTEVNGKVYLDPQGTATRAQIATLLMRYNQKFQ